MVAGSVVWVIPPGLARAQGPANGTAGWPTQPLRLVVPFAPGGTTDLAARLVAKGLAEHLGQPVIVDNRPGAGATLGSQAVAEARPDGYTLVMSNVASHAIGPGLYPGLRYDPVRDFAHIGLVISNPALFVSNKGFAPRTLGEVVAYSKTQSRGVAIASSGVGSTNHLLILQFAQTTGANLNHVPYRGAGPAMTDVIAGVVPMMSDSLPSAAGHVRAGSVRAMAMASEARHPAFPDIATFREQGVDLLSSSWFGISAPAGTPPPILARLSADLRAVLASAEVRDRFDEWGATPGALGPEAYTAFVAAEVARWQPILRDSGARAE
jgi:tripartite-type tricarboxylate transporter receptor subunit TctC